MSCLAEIGFAIGATAIIMWYFDPHRHKPYSTSEWRARMRELGIGIKKAK